MKVLHVNDHLALKGGVEVYLLALSRELERRGFQVGIAYASGDGNAWQNGYRIPAISSVDPRQRREGRVEMAKVLAKVRPDVCHIHSVYNPGILEACFDYGPSILHLHDYRYACPASSLYHRRTEQICERRCSIACFPIGLAKGCQTPRMPAGLSFYSRVKFVERNAHRFAAIIANSQYVGDRFRRNVRSLVTPNVVHYFCPIEASTQTPSAPLEPYVLFLGRVIESKGILEFVETLQHLPSEVSGVISGTPSDAIRKRVEERAEALNCGRRIRWTGWVDRDQISQIVEGAGVVVFPSIWAEPFGIVGLEAMARGVPVVGFDVGGVSDWLRDGENGYLVPRRDVSGMGQRINAILDDEQLRSRMGRRGIEMVRNHFSIESHMASLLSLYQGTQNGR